MGVSFVGDAGNTPRWIYPNNRLHFTSEYSLFKVMTTLLPVISHSNLFELSESIVVTIVVIKLLVNVTVTWWMPNYLVFLKDAHTKNVVIVPLVLLVPAVDGLLVIVGPPLSPETRLLWDISPPLPPPPTGSMSTRLPLGPNILIVNVIKDFNQVNQLDRIS